MEALTMTPSLPGPFFHGTRVRLAPGDHIVPAAEVNPADPAAAQAHPASDGRFTYNDSDPALTFMTEWKRDAAHWGPHVYRVAPLGTAFQDPNGSEGDYAVRGHLVIVAAA